MILFLLGVSITLNLIIIILFFLRFQRKKSTNEIDIDDLFK